MALIVTIMAVALMTALGAMLMLTSTFETAVSANYRDGIETMYAAESGIERVLQDLADAPDWDLVLSGRARSTFVDGAAGGVRQMAGGTTIDLTGETNRLRCGSTRSCSSADMDAITSERPWGTNNPRWELYGHGPLAAMLPAGRVVSHAYVIVWVADDPSENDGDALRDGQPPAVADARNPVNPGRGVLLLVAHAYMPGGARRVLEATVANMGATTPAGLANLRLLAWREVR